MKNVLILLLMVPVMLVTRGTVLYWMWGWYAVPLNLPAVSWAPVVGMVFMWDVLHWQRKTEKTPDAMQDAATAVFSYLLFAAYGGLLRLVLF